MNYIIFLLFSILAALNFRYAVFLFPAITFITPKGHGLIDVDALPYLSLNRGLVLLLFFTWIFRLFYIEKREVIYKNFPLKNGFTALIISYILSVFTNVDTLTKDFPTAIISFLEIFFPCFMIYRYINIESDKKIIKSIIFAGFVSSLIGSIFYVADINAITEYYKSTTPTERVMAADYEGTLRGLRATGTFSHPITFGAFLAMTFIVGVAAVNTKGLFDLREKYALSFAMAFYFPAILMTNSRTPLLMVAIGLSVAVLFGSFSLRVKYFTSFVVLLIFAYMILPEVFEKIFLSIVSIFDPDMSEDWSGSSLEMRQIQTAIAFDEFLKNPIFGGGFSATRSIIGAPGYEDFYNAESALYLWAIDLGLIGVAAKIYILWKIADIFYTKTPFNHDSRPFAIGLVVSYLVFIMATGVMDTLQYYMILSVLVMKIFYSSKVN